jgi:hypothetical protein
LCKQCGARFAKRYNSNRRLKKLYQEYVFGKQTLQQLADKHGTSKRTIQRHLDQYHEDQSSTQPVRSVVIGIDCSFFGRGHGIIVARGPSLKQNLYWKEITTENKTVYQDARRYLEAAGLNIQAVVLDAKHGIKEVFSDLVVQICQYHQQQIVGRYLTSKPKTEAGLELKLLSDSLTNTDEKLFTESLSAWHDKYWDFVKERTYKPDGKHWWYTHKRIRAAYRSLVTNLSYLFSYQRYPELHIPNTNNSLEGYFSKIKRILNNHNGLKRWRRYKVIETILVH